MIELRYQSDKISDEQAATIAAKLEESLRFNIDSIRKVTRPYNVTIEGDRFGPIIHNQPDLRIHVFYHDEWQFSPNDMDCLRAGVGQYLQYALFSLKLCNASAVVRFYSRTGHVSMKIG